MKNIALILILFSLNLFSQNLETNNEDNQFIIEALMKKMNIKKVNQNKLLWQYEEIYGWDENSLRSFDRGLIKNDIVKKYFNTEDLKHLEKQYLDKTLKWNLKKYKYKILDSLTIKKLDSEALKTRKMKYYYHSISEPFFSLDKKFVIIKIDFFCGFMCSNNCTYIYENKNGNWVKLVEWNCWAS